MDCLQAEKLFDRYLDREITGDDFGALEEHLRACPRCADNWFATRKAVDLLSALPELHPGPEVLSRLMVTLPRAKHRRSFHLTPGQAAAAVAIAAIAVSIAFWSGSRQMIAAAVENRGGHVVVVPRAGQPLVIPPGATIAGNLEVAGDVYVRGRVEGRISAEGRVYVEKPEGFWAKVARECSRLYRALRGGL
ncbi:MAG: zf-HC2 domain-containing protein [Bacteroidota bacterium]